MYEDDLYTEEYPEDFEPDIEAAVEAAVESRMAPIAATLGPLIDQAAEAETSQLFDAIEKDLGGPFDRNLAAAVATGLVEAGADPDAAFYEAARQVHANAQGGLNNAGRSDSSSSSQSKQGEPLTFEEVSEQWRRGETPRSAPSEWNTGG